MTLVIGYGNRLRGDDAAGPIVAEQVAAWNRPGVEAIAVQQLTPELAARIAAASRVLFVDASADSLAGAAAGIVSRRVFPGSHLEVVNHQMHPESMLALTLATRGVVPCGWFLRIRAHSFAVGAELSAVAREGVPAALRWVESWLASGG